MSLTGIVVAIVGWAEGILARLFVKDWVKLRAIPMGALFQTRQERVLDVGSGSGSWPYLLSKRFGIAADACDVGRYPRVYVEPTLFTSPSLPYATASYGVVMCMFVLHHCDSMNQQSTLIDESHRVLVPTGHLVIAEDLNETAEDAAMTHTHATAECFHASQEWVEILRHHGFRLVAEGRLPRYYNGYFSWISPYQPTQGWFIFRKEPARSAPAGSICNTRPTWPNHDVRAVRGDPR